MTVTNPTPETQHSRSFHTSVSRAYASVPHAKLSVRYGYEVNQSYFSPGFWIFAFIIYILNSITFITFG